MGCFCTRIKNDEKQDNGQKKVYSWDKQREFINISDYIIENLNQEEKVKLPGSINGQQIIIQNCINSSIYILDHTNSITVEDCVKCNIILGPIQGCLFLRQCKECTVVAACSQFRTRDCLKLNTFLFCVTQPIIEASTQMRFSNYQLSYRNIMDHLIKAGLNVLERKWDRIYDFTPVESEINWCFMDQKVSEFIFSPNDEDTYYLLRSVDQTWRTVINNELINTQSPELVMESSL